MKTVKSGATGRDLTRWAVATLFLGAAIGGATTPANAQCAVTNTVVNPGATYIAVYKSLNGSYLCSNVASNSASLCAPGPQLLRNRLTASAPTTATNPSCQFTCTGGCGTVTIDSSDGLPVELMDFEVVPVPANTHPAPKADLIGAFGIGGFSNNGLAFGSDGLLYMLLDGGGLYTVNTGNGAATFATNIFDVTGAQLVGFEGLAGQRAVPEPTSMVLLGLGLAALGFAKRKA